ncbi:MAG TPA: UDP-N-acetylglucosamine 2-epimerase (non-hydrolyzing), partial [Bacteroidia bacterium]|jgi:UDP-N-acetylglucosamine 2-epimerase (non-hydrolysing)
MAEVFFRQFGLVPDHFLDLSSSSPEQQVAEIISGVGELISTLKPALVVVVGDVNSTLAASIAANKLGVKLAHVESGLRSFDRSMPEEFNRVLTDKMSDLFFVTEQSGMDHLLAEGYDAGQVHFVGNTMIDTLLAFRKQIEGADALQRLSVEKEKYILMTMHRPATVDSGSGLERLCSLLDLLAARERIVFPVHPRTLANLERMGFKTKLERNRNLIMTGPQDYFAFQKLVACCRFIITDSGGIQEESTFLGKPCLTLRPNTERPITVTLGTNELVPFDNDIISEKVKQINEGAFKKGRVPPLWDGHATERIFRVINSEI